MANPGRAAFRMLMRARSSAFAGDAFALRESAINIATLSRMGVPKPAIWYAAQLDELSEDLFAESATLYAEHGVALQDGLKEISRLLRATRLLACAQVLRPVEKLITKGMPFLIVFLCCCEKKRCSRPPSNRRPCDGERSRRARSMLQLVL